jgi:hypothetical protein
MFLPTVEITASALKLDWHREELRRAHCWQVVVRRFIFALILLISGSASALADVRIVSSLGG